MAPPFQEAEFEIYYGEGICKLCDIIDVAAELGILTKSGPWYSYGDKKIGQGKEQVKKFLLENPKILYDIEQKIKEALGIVGTADEDSKNGP